MADHNDNKLPNFSWALVKDQEIAKRMTKFIELNTIGVSKDSQIRAAKVLHHVADSTEHGPEFQESDNFFEFGYSLMAKRWTQLRAAVNRSNLFSLPSFPSGTCSFSGHTFKPQPGKSPNYNLVTLEFFCLLSH